jgi:ABC-type molybdate transport system substrate-binding protein
VRQVETLETTPVRYLVHVGTGSPQAALAREFVAYLGSDAARTVWLRHGFGVP